MRVQKQLSEKGAASLEYTVLAAIFALTVVGSTNSLGDSLHSFGARQGAQFLRAVNKDAPPQTPGLLPYGGGTDPPTVRPKSDGVNVPPNSTPPKKEPPPPETEPVTE